MIKNIAFISLTAVIFNSTFSYASTEMEKTSNIEKGKRIYLSGVGSNEKNITAISAGNVRLEKEKTSCANCHRRSGYGTSEGGILIPSITGNSLFNSREFKYKELKRKSSRPITRKSYNKSSLINAIKYGIDSNGRKLNPLMPRYNMSDTDINSLVSYLSTLGSKSAPGVNDDIINFATIVTPGVSKIRKEAMLATLDTYIKAKNSETRLEKRRASNSPWHKKWAYSAYRKWKLHVWELTGNKESWPKQLNTFYKKQPVFSIMSGISTGTWQPMHDFCNEKEIPCLFPNTVLPGKDKHKTDSAQDSYSMYFSEGIALEAKVIAKHISNSKSEHRCQNILQIIDDTHKTKIAADALKNQLLSYEYNAQSSIIVKNTAINSKILYKSLPTCIVHWTNKTSSKILNILNKHNVTQEYITQNIMKSYLDRKVISDRLVYISTPFSLDKNKELHLKRIKVWSKMNKITPYIEDVSANAYYAVTLTAKAIKHIRTHFSRDYFIERLEHMVDNMAFHSIYNRFTLGPGQRYASKGAYIIGPMSKTINIKQTEKAKWIIP